MPTALAPAKLNLYLEVVGRRPDGYHELRTLFQTVAFGDDVTVERTAAPGVACEVSGADLPSDESNLAVRAARAWLEAAGAAGGARIRLEKRVPVGGGMGGGSSDAAAVLRLLERSGPALGAARLREVARGLGADVPFLLQGGTATATGRGDEVAPLPPAPPLAVVLVVPPFGTETAVVYGRVHERVRRAPPDGLARAVLALRSGEPARVREAHHDDLAEAALRAYPALREFTARTERLLGRPPAMTGSGSTLFDVPDAGEAEEVVARLASLPGRRVVTTFASVPGALP
jgi:4-diphosphocytidyl-2-C-methyl-D-erythritol kinase